MKKLADLRPSSWVKRQKFKALSTNLPNLKNLKLDLDSTQTRQDMTIYSQKQQKNQWMTKDNKSFLLSLVCRISSKILVRQSQSHKNLPKCNLKNSVVLLVKWRLTRVVSNSGQNPDKFKKTSQAMSLKYNQIQRRKQIGALVRLGSMNHHKGSWKCLI